MSQDDPGRLRREPTGRRAVEEALAAIEGLIVRVPYSQRWEALVAVEETARSLRSGLPEPDHVRRRADGLAELKRLAPELDPKFTCDDCGRKEVCEFAFDIFNLDGDCLEDK